MIRCSSSALYPVALNKHGTLPAAPFVSMLRASFVHGFRSGPSANEEKLVTRAGYAPGPVDSHVEDNQTEKELPMKTYIALYAEDVRHYSTVEIEATDTVDAIAKAQAFDLTDVPTNPDWHNAVCRRIVEVTDEDENIVAEFIPIDNRPRFLR